MQGLFHWHIYMYYTAYILKSFMNIHSSLLCKCNRVLRSTLVQFRSITCIIQVLPATGRDRGGREEKTCHHTCKHDYQRIVDYGMDEIECGSMDMVHAL